jgi:2-methylisocitrate lyase-like PEP mutase family enzyme
MLAQQLLAVVSPAALRAGDGHPIEVLAQALGLPRTIAPDVQTIAGCYQPHTRITAEADAAVERLIDECGAVADEVTAARIGLLVQASPALAALSRGDNPPVPVTRRVAPTGETIDVSLAGIAFGAGRHACPGRAHALALAARELPFHRLHYGQTPLILPNAWDYASGAALAQAGFAALGTTSLGVAAAAGVPDGEGRTLDETLALAEKLTRLNVPITVDLESGFGTDPAELAAQLAQLGVAGVNLEDGRGDTLTDPSQQAALLRTFKDAAPALFLNARIDTHWRGIETDTTISRAQRYAAAGADGIFVPGLDDDHEIAELVAAVDLPLNVLAQPNLERLTQLGVRRISTGSLLFRSAITAATTAANAVRDGQPLPDAVSYKTLQTLISG